MREGQASVEVVVSQTQALAASMHARFVNDSERMVCAVSAGCVIIRAGGTYTQCIGGCGE